MLHIVTKSLKVKTLNIRNENILVISTKSWFDELMNV